MVGVDNTTQAQRINDHVKCDTVKCWNKRKCRWWVAVCLPVHRSLFPRWGNQLLAAAAAAAAAPAAAAASSHRSVDAICLRVCVALSPRVVVLLLLLLLLLLLHEASRFMHSSAPRWSNGVVVPTWSTCFLTLFRPSVIQTGTTMHWERKSSQPKIMAWMTWMNDKLS